MNEPGIDAILNLLAAGDRREIIQVLRQQATGATTIVSLAESLAAAEVVTENDKRRLAISLYHNHLPTLDDHGLVEFDPERGTVRYQPDEHVERMIGSPSELDEPVIQFGSSD